MQQFAIVFTCNPDQPRLSTSTISSACSLAGGEAVGEPRWLSPGIACEVMFSTDKSERDIVLAALREEFAGQETDVNLIFDDCNRRKSLLLADMDSTIIQQECIDEIASYAGMGGQVSAITERAMRGEIDFEEALRARVSLLKGLKREDLHHALSERIQLMPGAEPLVATMAANGAYCALVSGGFTFFTSEIARRVGFHENRANTLLFDHDVLSGEVATPILGREAKLAALVELLGAHNLGSAASIAVGDGANDLAMIRHAGLGVAYRAKPVVGAEADANIVYGDLTALLYLQGYGRDEIVWGKVGGER